jgi:hypothetical protein
MVTPAKYVPRLMHELLGEEARAGSGLLPVPGEPAEGSDSPLRRGQRDRRTVVFAAEHDALAIVHPTNFDDSSIIVVG